MITKCCPYLMLKYVWTSLLNCAPCTHSRLRTLPIIDARLTPLHAYAPYPSLIRALRVFFVFCCVVSFLRYCLRLKNPRKAKGPDFIPLKVIKFASNCYLSSPLKHYNKRPRKKKQLLRKAKNSISKTHFQEKWKK